MGKVSWPSNAELDEMKKLVAEIAGRCTEDVRVVVSPYRICPLGAHVDHQGGTVSAMTINKGILLGFVPSGDSQVILNSGQFKGEVRFSVDKILHPIHIVKASDNINESGASKLQQECTWGNYAKGALYALQSRGNVLTQGIIGFVSGSEDLDSSGLSSSAAVGVAYLLAFESANNLDVSPTENIEYDRLIENEYLGLENGILDQSAILLSSYGCLTCMNCKTKEHKLVRLPEFQILETEKPKAYRILLAFSGLKQALTSNPGYNRRVAECQEAARLLLHATGNEAIEPLLSNVEPAAYETHKSKLEPTLARRAEHYFSENVRVAKGLDAWASGKLEDFGKLISASGLSSIQNYECETETETESGDAEEKTNEDPTKRRTKTRRRSKIHRGRSRRREEERTRTKTRRRLNEEKNENQKSYAILHPPRVHGCIGRGTLLARNWIVRTTIRKTTHFMEGSSSGNNGSGDPDFGIFC